MTTTAVDLLFRGNDDRQEPFINKYWGPLVGGSIALFASFSVNFGTRRPVLSGVQKHILSAIAGGFAGEFIEQRRRNYLAEREAVFRHYVTLHPEEFKEPEPKLIGDIVEPWIPIR